MWAVTFTLKGEAHEVHFESPLAAQIFAGTLCDHGAYSGVTVGSIVSWQLV